MAADDLSETAALAHYCAIAWISATERFDCLIPRRLLDAALPLTHDRAAALEELVEAGYWRVVDKSVEIVEHGGVIRQSLVSVDKKRSTDAKAAKSYRSRRDASVTDAATDSVTDSATESARDEPTEAAPRLPTCLPTGLDHEASPTTGRDTCTRCGRTSRQLDGGLCRRDECVRSRRRGAA